MNKEKAQNLYKEFKELRTKIDSSIQVRDVHQDGVDRVITKGFSIEDCLRCDELAFIILNECKDYLNLDPKQLHELYLHNNKTDA